MSADRAEEASFGFGGKVVQRVAVNRSDDEDIHVGGDWSRLPVVASGPRAVDERLPNPLNVAEEIREDR